MSFRSVFLGKFLCGAAVVFLPAAGVLAQDGVSQPEVANSKYQIEGVVNTDSVYVRSGPGEGYYSTQQLQKGADVTVVGIKFDWLKILPPDGSYSYVASVFVDRNDNVNVRAGSLVNPAKTTVQTHLSKDDTVQIIGKEDEYLKIKPPQGAYLYINKDFVTIAHTVATNAAPGDSSPIVTAAPISTQTPAATDAATPTTQPDATASASTATVGNAAPVNPIAAGVAAKSGEAASAILTSTPTTAPSAAVASAATTQPAAVAVVAPNPVDQFADFESQFAAMARQPLEDQNADGLVTKYQSVAKADALSPELKEVVQIRIATLQARSDNKVKLLEAKRMEKEAAEKRLALQAEQQELAERLKQSEIQVFAAVGQLEPSSLQVGGGTLYRLTDPATGRTVVYVRTGDTKVTGLMGQFVGITGEVTTDSQLSLRVVSPTDAQVVEPAKVNASVMADIVPPSLLARQASAN
jgi:uncharacterized protein YgiM (DUF1202 family)